MHSADTMLSCSSNIIRESQERPFRTGGEKHWYGKAGKIHSNMIIAELIDIDVCVCSNVVKSPAFPANGSMDDTNTL